MRSARLGTMTTPMTTRAIRVPDALWEAAKITAVQYDVHLSEVIRKHLEDFVASSTWYKTTWDCKPPAWGESFIVESDGWSPDLSTRHIFKWKPGEG